MIDLPVPTIIRPVEAGAWNHADAQMQRLGLPRQVRRAIENEMKRIVGEKPIIQRATIDDLAKYVGEPKLGTFPFPVMSPKIAAAPVSPITYIGRSTGAVAGGSYTYANAPLTPAAADRLVVVLNVNQSILNNATTSITVGGTPLTLWSPGRIFTSSFVVSYMSFWYGIISAGATPNIVVTSTAANESLDVWCISGCSATPVDQVAAANATSASCVLNDVEVKASGALISGIICQSAASASYTEAWTGADAVIEDTDLAFASSNIRIGAAHIPTTGASTLNDFTWAIAASKERIAGAISFGP